MNHEKKMDEISQTQVNKFCGSQIEQRYIKPYILKILHTYLYNSKAKGILEERDQREVRKKTEKEEKDGQAMEDEYGQSTWY